MKDVVLKVEGLSKMYRLGEVGTGTLSHDLNRWWASLRGKEDPHAKVGQINDRNRKDSESQYVWALKDISFEVQRGEVLGIIGKNGAGKSTLLKLISRITSPTSGIVKAKGRIASLLEVGTGMHPEMTARENIFLNGAILGMTKAEIKSKFDEIVDFAGCSLYVDTPIKRFSSGMRVRLGFAVAAFLEPEILIVDEVLAVGDAEFQKKAIGKMKQVSGEGGRTVLFVSHNLHSVKSLCDRSVLLENGSISFSGNNEEVIEEYMRKSTQEITQKSKYIPESSLVNNGFELVHVAIKDRNGNLSNKLHIGEHVSLELKYKSDQKSFSNLSIAIAIYDSLDQKITDLWNHEKMGIRELPGSAIATCHIPLFPLKEGFYKLNITIRKDNTTILYKKNILGLQVLGGDYFGSGVVLKSNSLVKVNQEWEFNHE